ncbi:ceramide synthase 1-like [Panonychus citri]|uniref:ceramide synthase 1-like n=1 Tax=Panonychus citri TaxID=50023 RepID=UPI0023073F72|nr:ceramide synthase 1-like [Panonychus citri]XP_053208712.1 ceramide synthase 1-like [Panonychus citri]XP_053208713.1 ceramide synthase 1-like [Panonychus citri]
MNSFSLPSNYTWEPTSSYFLFFLESGDFIRDNFNQLLTNYSFPEDTIKDLNKCLTNLHRNDYLLMFILAIFWTILRNQLTSHIFKPIARYYVLPKQESDKLPESAWKFMFYLSTWSYSAYILLWQPGTNYFYKPTDVWKDYSMSLDIPKEIYNIFLIEIGFYLHSLYATIFVDHWRRDSLVLIGHHIVASFLLVFTLSIRCHRTGLIAIFLHDACDIILEGTKTCLYFKRQNNKNINFFETIANIGFLLFTVTWFITRLYWFPLRNIFISSIYVHQNGIQVPFILFLNSLLYILLTMNLYWFSFIIKLLFKVITGQTKELEDNREYEHDEFDKTVEEKETKDKNESDNQLNVSFGKDKSLTEFLLHKRKEDENRGRAT